MFKILYNGKPIKTNVNAVYDGYNINDEEAYAIKTVSDKNGIVKIKPSANGLWMIQASVSDNGNNQEYDDVSFRSVVVFTVK